MRKVFASDGLAGVQRGLTIAFYREFVQSSVRLGLSKPVSGYIRKGFNIAEGHPTPWYVWVLSGAFTGGLGGFVSNPAEVIKARAQSGRFDYSGPVDGSLFALN